MVARRRKKSSTRRSGTRRSSTRRMRGKGIVDTVKKVHKFVKDNKLISSGLGLIGQPGLGSVAGMLGYGRRRRKGRSRRTRRVSSAPVAPKRRMRGRGMMAPRIVLTSPGIIGTGVSALPMTGVGRKKVMHGKGIFGDLGSGIGSVFGGLGGGLGSALGGLFGRGRGRRQSGTPAGRSGIKI